MYTENIRHVYILQMSRIAYHKKVINKFPFKLNWL